MRTRAEQGTSCLVRQSSPKGMVVSETSSGKNVKRKVTQLAEAKLGSEGLSTGQEDTEAGTLEEYAIVLSFELSLRK
ncbi:hypothetical protein BHM03_00029873 [Ensete ventricosum]|nr:hypothetical protein BHM03_00029873 [Ensete ventricosum]